MMIWIDKLRRDHALAPDQYRQLLATTDTDAVEYLHRQAGRWLSGSLVMTSIYAD